MGTMAFGIFSITFLTLAVCCLYCKKPVLGMIASAAAMVFTYLTGCCWKEMLTESGKDTTLLGFNRYPAALIILSALLLTAVVLIIVSLFRTVQKHKKKK